MHLLVDGPALVAGLEVHSNTVIECTAGGGFYLKAGSQRAIIRNAHRSKDEVTDSRISIRHCFFNGNSEGQSIVGPMESVFRAAQERDGTFMSGLQFFGVHYLSIEQVTLWGIRSFGLWIANAKFIQLRSITVDNGIPPYPEREGLSAVQAWLREHSHNRDGVHFCGPIQYLTIDGLMLRTLDDGLSLTADDASAAKADAMGPYVGFGPITDVTVNNVLFMGVSHAVRLLSATSRMDRIVISNLSGTVRERMVVISPFINRGRGNFGSVIISNVAVDLLNAFPRSQAYALANKDISPEAVAGTARWDWSAEPPDLGEETDLPLFSLNGQIENLQLRQVVTKGVSGRPIIRVGKNAKIASFTLDLSIHDPTLQAMPVRLLGEVERLNLLLDWRGSQPISCMGGKIAVLRQLDVPLRECCSLR
ncbi:hypothetical protein [Steroidobacter agaridevorans]|uniref:hypothetical protein n=1 Tax=Steroidobacter agaridevorans TaxID=2695856 RepID=UPI00137AA020|nr:hypothetical protein [Steroidobacter agaridevorans]